MHTQLQVPGQVVLIDGVSDRGEILSELQRKPVGVTPVIDTLQKAARELGRDGLQRSAASSITSSAGVCAVLVSSIVTSATH